MRGWKVAAGSGERKGNLCIQFSQSMIQTIFKPGVVVFTSNPSYSGEAGRWIINSGSLLV